MMDDVVVNVHIADLCAVFNGYDDSRIPAVMDPISVYFNLFHCSEPGINVQPLAFDVMNMIMVHNAIGTGFFDINSFFGTVMNMVISHLKLMGAGDGDGFMGRFFLSAHAYGKQTPVSQTAMPDENVLFVLLW